jgi:hypothetical protein
MRQSELEKLLVLLRKYRDTCFDSVVFPISTQDRVTSVIWRIEDILNGKITPTQYIPKRHNG